jgi:hypothetical protein
MKSEARISKYETISNYQNSNDRNRIMPRGTFSNRFVLVFRTFGFRICFEFRASNFEFNNHFKTYRSKTRK